MTHGGMKVAASPANATAGKRISIWSVLIVAVFALMTGLSSNAMAEEVSIKSISSSFSQIPGTVVVIPPSGIPTTHTTSGNPPKVTIDLPPGTYTFQFSGTNPDTKKTETGARQVTVVAGQRSSVPIAISEAGTINDPLNSTAANGATNTGTASAAPRTTRSGTRVNASLSAGASGTFVDGIDMLAGFSGGNPTGVNALSTSGNNVGTHVAGNLRVKMPAPSIGNWGLGADDMFFNFRGESIWGRSVDKFDRITGSFEAPGLGILNNVLLAAVDDVEARTEIDRLEFAAALGYTFNLGPMEAYSLGNLLFGSMGNLGSTDRRRQGVKLTTEGEVFYQHLMRHDDVDFGSPSTNEYRNETEVNRAGVRVGGKISMPLVPNLGLKIGGGVGFYRDNRTLDGTLNRNGVRATETDEDVVYGYEVSAAMSMVAKFGIVRAVGYVDYGFESKNPLVHFRASTNDEYGLTSTSAHQVTAGAKIIIPTDAFYSDIRLKTDIVRLGALPSGLPVYSYKYLWSSETFVGVLAQEARLMFPDAVKEIEGFLAVDYSKIK